MRNTSKIQTGVETPDRVDITHPRAFPLPCGHMLTTVSLRRGGLSNGLMKRLSTLRSIDMTVIALSVTVLSSVRLTLTRRPPTGRSRARVQIHRQRSRQSSSSLGAPPVIRKCRRFSLYSDIYPASAPETRKREDLQYSVLQASALRHAPQEEFDTLHRNSSALV